MSTVSPVSASNLHGLSAAATAAAAELRAALPKGVSCSQQDRISYARDLWPKGLIWIRRGEIPPPPDLIVWPSSEEEVIQTIRIARKYRVPVIPFGAGSGVCGGTWAVRGGIALDLKRLDRVSPVDAASLTVEAQAGVLGDPLESALNADGYTLGHFPASMHMSTLGGWLAARSAGQLSTKYGKIEDMALGVRAITGAGELVATPRRPFEGPDLVPLLLGSEGTLCAFTSATLRVHRVPEHRAFEAFEFKTIAAGLEAIRQVLFAGLRPAVVRLYDPFDTALIGRGKSSHPANLSPSMRGQLRRQVLPTLLRRVAPKTIAHASLLNRAVSLFHSSLLLFMFEGERTRSVRECEQAVAICRRLRGTELGDGPGKAWYAKRYDVSFKMSKLVDHGVFADTMEVATTWDKVLSVYERVREAAAPFAFVMCHFSHAYPEGCSLYFSFAFSASAERLEEHYRELWKAALGAAMGAGATASHHHGIGLLKAHAFSEELKEGRRMLSALKQAFDPDGIMNPGKLGL